MSDFINRINKTIHKNIDTYTAVRTGEITSVNSDGTYDVKIAQSTGAYPNVDTIMHDTFFSEGEIVDIAFEYGSMESPKIMGTAKKIAQEPKEIEVDYSGSTGEEGAGQGISTDIYSEGGTDDGWIARQSTGYTIAHNATTGDILYAGETYLGAGYIFGWGDLFPPITKFNHILYRVYIYFDTSDIPAEATINSVQLYIYRHVSTMLDADFNLVIQNGQPTYPHSPLNLNDYDKSYYSNNGGQIDTSTMTTSSYSSISFNSNGIAWINKGGTTKLCLRSSREIAGISWGTTDTHYEILGIHSADSDSSHKPYLNVNYTY